MSLLNIPNGVSKGSSVAVTLSKSELFALPSVSADSYYGVQGNVVKCVIKFVATFDDPNVVAPESKLLNFDLSQSSPMASLKVSPEGLDLFLINEVLLIDADGGAFSVVPDSSLINSNILAFGLDGGTPLSLNNVIVDDGTPSSTDSKIFDGGIV
jgi:hypothetical protein